MKNAYTPVMHRCYPEIHEKKEASRNRLIVFTCQSGILGRAHDMVVDVVNGASWAALCTCSDKNRLEVGCRVWTYTGVVVLFEVGLEGRGARLRLVAKSGTGTSHEIIVVLGDALLALLHAPEDKGNTAKQEGTANTTNNTTDDFLVALAQTAAAVAATFLWRGWLGVLCLSGSCADDAGAGLGDLRCLSVGVDGGDDGSVELGRGGDEGRGPDDGSGVSCRARLCVLGGSRGIRACSWVATSWGGGAVVIVVVVSARVVVVGGSGGGSGRCSSGVIV
jgi:hypothetical protein